MGFSNFEKICDVKSHAQRLLGVATSAPKSAGKSVQNALNWLKGSSLVVTKFLQSVTSMLLQYCALKDVQNLSLVDTYAKTSVAQNVNAPLW
jgi:hypothetical protein